MNSDAEAWHRLSRILHAGGPEAGLSCIYPGSSHHTSYLDALGAPTVAAAKAEERAGEELRGVLDSLLRQLGAFEDISRCPILAITGLLNAGKSTLLATYLSPQNRQRVLRGLANDSGTHRFVLWLPKVWWDEAELLNTLIAFMTQLFGHPPERLAEDAETAALQYNGRIISNALMRDSNSQATQDASMPVASQAETRRLNPVHPLNVPLIAYDEGLDRLKLGLMDCPDIQTGFLTEPLTPTTSELPQLRRQQLSRVGRLCSAFVVVAKLSSLHDEGLMQILTTLRDAMPGVPRMLAVNRVKARYSPATVLEQAGNLVDRFGIRSVYLAYDYRSAFAAEISPPPPARMQFSDADERLPVFFEATQAIENDASPAEKSQYLFDLGEQLDVGTLARESSRSLNLQLKTKATQAMEWLVDNLSRRRELTREIWQILLDACYEFMAERDASGNPTGLRLQASPAIVAQIADSLHRTAPGWMRLSLSIDRTARQLQSAIANSASRFRILQSASDSVSALAKRFRRGEGAQVVTPQKMARAIRDGDVHAALEHLTDESLLAGCEQAIKRFAEEDKTELQAAELDAWSRQVWESMSLKDKLWKGTQPLAVLTAPLLAAILVPIDAGGTAVLLFASAKELLAAAGIAAVMTPMATGGETLSIVHRETPWRQLSDLFAILCDSIGIQRPASGELPHTQCQGANRQLFPSNLQCLPPNGQAAFCEWELNPHTLKDYQLCLQQLSSQT